MAPTEPKKSHPRPSGSHKWAMLASLLVLLVVVLLLLSARRPSPPRLDQVRTTDPSHTRPVGSDGPSASQGEPPSVETVHLAPRDGHKTLVDELAQKYDPTLDSWDTEVLTSQSTEQIDRLGKLIALRKIKLESVADVVSTDFTCEPLRPALLETVFHDGAISVRRFRAGDPPEAPRSPADRGGAGRLIESLKPLVEALGDGPHIRCKLKQTKIDASESFFTTQIDFQASNRTTNGRAVQLNATWHCKWTYPDEAPADKPRLSHIWVEHFEQVDVRPQRGAWFADCTESVMRSIEHYPTQVRLGIDHWVMRINEVINITLQGHHGLAIGDVNGDGLEDLYVCDTGGLPNRLYVQQEDGTVSDESTRAGVDWMVHSVSALLIDLDNDGDQDLVVGTVPNLLIMENDGDGHFELRYEGPVVTEPYSMCAADYDLDGDLDIYVCSYSSEPNIGVLPVAIPYHDADNGSPNALLRNEGGFQFVDVTKQTGLDQGNSRFSFAATWQDYDLDGDMDIYVANDYGRNNLFRNDGGHFVDVAAQAGVQDIASGMSVSWADYNRDGLMDLYVGNMFSAAGNRVAYQRQFAPDSPVSTVDNLRRTARGNTLFANAGDGTFQDTSETANVTMGRWAWSSKFADLNNDSWPDIVVANGFVTQEDSGDL